MSKVFLIIEMLIHSLAYSCQSSPNEVFTSPIVISDTTPLVRVEEQTLEGAPAPSDTVSTFLVDSLPDISIFGSWKVTKFVGGAFAEISETEAKTFIGKRVHLNSDTANFFRESCQSPQYRTRVADTEEHFYYQFRTYPKTLGIDSRRIRIVDIYCSVDEEVNLEEEYPEFSLEVFDENTLIYFTQGYFFYLSKVSEP